MRWAALLVVAVSIAMGPGSARAQPATSFHDLKWFVHVDLITAQRPLGFYQSLIADSTLEAGDLLQGSQGPFDDACCVALDDVSVETFGTPGDGLDVIDNAGERDALSSIGLPGRRAFIVERLNFCSGPGNPVGCADTPACAASPADLKLIVAMQAYDEFDSFSNTLAHELGHNTCLVHVSNNTCQLMAAVSGGGCVSSSECSEYVEERTSVGGSCGCYVDANTLAADGTACTEFAGGICSGGLCGDPASEASTSLFAAAGTASAMGDPPDNPLRMGALAGNWSDLGTFSSSREPTGLAYAAERGALYGVAASGGTNELFTIDPSTGATTLVGNVTGIDAGEPLVALAWDPGAAGEGDDRFFALDLAANDFNDLYAIDPDTAAGLKLGSFFTTGTGGFSGLAYDPVTTTLFAAASFGNGLFEVGLVCTPGCPLTEITDPRLSVNKFEPALAYSAQSSSIHHIGRQGVGTPRTEYDSYDAGDLSAGTITKLTARRGLDGFSTGGLAALPVPEPGAGALLLAALLSLAAYPRRLG